MSSPRFDRYRSSGVEWLLEVPRHWEIHPLKRICAILPSNIDKKTHDDESPVRLCNYTDVYYNDRITGDLDLMMASASAEQIAKFTLRRGDTIITKDSETADDIAVSAYVPEDLPGVVCGYHLAVLRPSERVHGPFVKRLFDSHYLRASVEVRANGLTRVGLSTDALATLPIPLPPLEDQVLIASFLDHETARIDSLVLEQTRLIDLLAEKRQALISHAVTKGLNPDAAMTPSGVECLGDLPAHWASASLIRVAQRVVVGIAEAATHAYADTGIPILRSTNIRPGRIEGDVFRIAPSFAAGRAAKRIQAGDLVTVRTGNAGVTAVVPPELDGCQCFTMLITTLKPEHVPAYYCYWLNSSSARFYFTLEGWGTAQVNISVPILKAFPVPIPPVEEQADIVEYLDRQLTEIDGLSREARGVIDLLQERRIALISAAVTGQIDVRALAVAGVA